MAGKGREIADAYIEVHGDLSKFRRDLQRGAMDAAAKAGNAAADKFGEEMERRGKDQMGERMDSIFDAAFTEDTIDWKRAFKKFDPEVDRAHQKMNEFLDDAHEKGLLFGKDVEEIRRRMDGARSTIVATAEAQRKSKEELDRYKVSFDGMVKESEKRIFEKNWRRLADYMADTNMGPNLKSLDATTQFASEMRKAADEARRLGRISDDSLRDVNSRLDSSVDSSRKWSTHARDINKNMSGMLGKMAPISRIADMIKSAWARMDNDVRLVVNLIAAGAGHIATLGSGLASSGTALVSSLGLALASAVPLASAFAGMGLGIALAISGMDDMKKKFPGIVTAAKEVGDAWKDQADSFATQWGPAVETFLETLGNKMASVDFGGPLGEAFGKITTAFTEVLNSPGFNAFLQALTGDIPDAVAGFGEGFAGVMEAVMNLLAGAAPVAKQLGEMFSIWGKELGEVTEKARESGVMNDIFEKAADSLVAILDFTGSLTNTLGNLFMVGADSGNSMLESLTGIVDKFNDWIQTDAGRDALTQWFRDGEEIMRSLEPLLVGVGEAMAILVTPRSIDLFADLMQRTGDFLPILAQLLDAISNVGTLNIFVGVLGLIGDILEPLMPTISKVATLLGDALLGSVDALSPVMTSLGEALVPIIELGAQLLEAILPHLPGLFEALSGAVVPLIDIIGNLIQAFADSIPGIDGLSGVVGGLIDIMIALLGAGEDVFSFFAYDLPAAGTEIGNFFDDVKRNLEQVGEDISGFVDGFTDGFDNIMKEFGNFTDDVERNINDIGTFFTGGGFGEMVGGWFEPLFTGAQDTWGRITGWLDSEFGWFFAKIEETGNRWGEEIWAPLEQLGKEVWGRITEEWGNFVSDIQGGVDELTTGWNTMWSDIGDGFKEKFSEPLKEDWDAIVVQWNDDWGGLKNGWNDLWTGIGAGWEENVMTPLREGWAELTSGWNSGMDELGAGWDGMLEDIGSAFSDYWGTFTDGWNELVAEPIGSFVDDTVENIKTFFTEKLPEVGQQLVDGLLLGISDAWAGLTDGVAVFVEDFVQSVRDFFGIQSPSTVFAEIGGFLVEGLGQGFSDAWAGFIAGVTGLLGEIATKFSEKWEEIKTNASEKWTEISTSLGETWEGIKTNAGTKFGEVKGSITQAWEDAKTDTASQWSTITTDLGTKWEGLKANAGTKFSEIKTNIGTKWQEVKTNTSTNWSSISSSLGTKWEDLKRNAGTKFNDIKSKIQTAWQNTKNDTTSKWNSMKSTTTGIWNTLSSSARTKFGDIKKNISSKLSEAKNSATTHGRTLKTNLTSAFQGAVSAARDKFSTMLSTIKTKGGSIVSYTGTIPGKISGSMSGLGGLLVGAGSSIMAGLRRGLESGYGAVKGLVGGIASWIRNNKGPLPYDRVLLKPAGEAIMEGLTRGLEIGMDDLTAMLKTITAAIGGGLDDKSYITAGVSAAEAFANGFDEKLSLKTASLTVDSGSPFGSAFAGVPVNGFAAPMQANAGTIVNINEGAIALQSRVQNPETAAHIVLDEFAALTKL